MGCCKTKTVGKFEHRFCVDCFTERITCMCVCLCVPYSTLYLCACECAFTISDCILYGMINQGTSKVAVGRSTRIEYELCLLIINSCKTSESLLRAFA